MTKAPSPRRQLAGIEKLQRLEKALAVENWYSLDDALSKCREGIFQFHDSPACVCITHLVKKTNGTVACSVVAIGGTMAGVNDMVPIVEAFARREGCAILTWSGRRGWDRAHKALSTGYHPVSVVYEKELK